MGHSKGKLALHGFCQDTWYMCSRPVNQSDHKKFLCRIINNFIILKRNFSWYDWLTYQKHKYHVSWQKPHQAIFPFECPVNITAHTTQHPKRLHRSITRLHIYASNQFPVTSVFIELGHSEGDFYFFSILHSWDYNTGKFYLARFERVKLCSMINSLYGQGTWKLVHCCIESCCHLAFGSGWHDSPQPWTSFQVSCHLTVQLILFLCNRTFTSTECYNREIHQNGLVKETKL